MAIVTADTLPWLVSAVLSLIYFWVYLFPGSLNLKLEHLYEPEGFCITNYDPHGDPPCAATPNSFFAEVGKLVGAPALASGAQDNSHFWAFSVDCWFAIIVLSIGLFGKKNSNQGIKTALGGVVAIMSHGLLHWWLGYFRNCVLITSPGARSFGTLFYALFIFVLCIVGFNLTSNLTSKWLKRIASAVVTYLIVHTSTSKGSISPIFGGTQLLGSIVFGFFPKKGVVTPKMGYFFIAPCVVSLVELLYCTESGKPTLFNKYWGHFWYDVTLHTVIVVAQLTPRAPAMKQD